ncbi:MAG: NAD-dependent epimerase/dehydratase family protein [Nitriliruptorales bacterium]|nr:NAD-dependent epimerase/dehydratase family protein [Nitriliruptorales bacterium]
MVTGGAGFIGTTIVPALLADGADVTVADLRVPTSPDVKAVVGDLRDPAVRRAAVPAGTTAIVHLAALTSVLQSVRRPAGFRAVNVDMTAALLEQARELDVSRFVFASTNAVVGDAGGKVIDEQFPLRPLTPYGATKAAAEMLLSAYAHSYGIQACALRLANVYGPGMQRKDSFIPRLMRATREGATVEIYGDGLQVRDLVHADDVCRGLRVAWHSGCSGPLIVGSGHSVSVLEMVETVRAVTGRPLRTRHVPSKEGEMRAVTVSIDAARALGYEPQIELAEGLASVWAEFAEQAPAPLGG